MKKDTKTTYVPPLVRVRTCILKHTVLTGSLRAPTVTIDEAQEEEWIVS